VDENGRTSNPRIVAAGDAINGGASVVQAVREAKRAVAALDWTLR
jgi:NADPH-dependent glutamate synthase beta subunit-like oxidoreductase